MKKRFIRLFMFATVIVGMGALSSCKDYDEERVDDLSQKVTSLEQNLQAQINALTTRVGDLETLFATFKSCECVGCQCGDVDKKIQDAINAWAAAHPFPEAGISKSEVVQLINDAIAGIQPGLSQAEVAQMIANAIAGIQQCTCKCLTAEEVGEIASAILADYMSKHPYPAPGITAEEVTNILNAALANYVTQQQLQDAKDELNKAIKAAEQKMDALEAALADKADKKVVEDLLTTVNDLTQQVAEALGKAAAAQDAAEKANDAAQKAQQTADEAQKLADANKARIDALEQFKQELEQQLVIFVQFKQDVEQQLADLNQFKQDIEQMIPQLTEQLANIAKEAAEAKAKAEANATQIQALQTALDKMADDLRNEIKEATDELKAKDTELANAIDAINEKIKDMATKEDIAGTLGYALDLFNKAIAYTDAADAIFKAQSDAADAALQSEIDQLQKDLNTLGNKVEKNSDAIAQLANALKSSVERATNIVLQGTSNPLYGTFSLPFGIQSNLLIAYKGENVGGAFIFPNPTFIDDPDAETYMSGQTLMNEEGNAGTLYLTVNPAEVDFSGTILTLENSLGEASPIKLGALKKSDKKLTFGATRAAANGFYECTATLDPAQFDEAKLNIDEKSLKQLYKDEKAVANALYDYVKNNLTGEGSYELDKPLEDLYNVVKTTLDALKIDALAARGTWADEFGEHSILSQYGIAATAVAPLNFTSLDALSNFTHTPGYYKVTEFADRLCSRITGAFKNALSNLDVSGVTINHISLTTSGTYIVDIQSYLKSDIKGTADVDGTYDLLDASGTVIGWIDLKKQDPATVTAKFTGKTIDLLKIMQEVFTDANATMDDLNDMVDQVNDLIKDIDTTVTALNNKFDRGQFRMDYWMDKINSFTLRGIKKLPKLTKPALAVVSDKGATLAGFRGHCPTCSGDITLYPTTYSCEYLAPVFKKVVTVNGKKQTINADGSINATNIQTGLNEIKYAALDYAGNEIDGTYYITVE